MKNSPKNKANTLKYELKILDMPCGRTVAEREVKKNADNYDFHFPDRIDPYALPEKTYHEEKEFN